MALAVEVEVEVELGILVEVAGFHDARGAELDVEGVGTREVFDFHGTKSRPRVAVRFVREQRPAAPYRARPK